VSPLQKFIIFCGPLSTVLLPVLASSFLLRQDFSKRASCRIVCVQWCYNKEVWGVVKSWEFEGNLRCSKILRVWRKNSINQNRRRMPSDEQSRRCRRIPVTWHHTQSQGGTCAGAGQALHARACPCRARAPWLEPRNTPSWSRHPSPWASRWGNRASRSGRRFSRSSPCRRWSASSLCGSRTAASPSRRSRNLLWCAQIASIWFQQFDSSCVLLCFY